MLYLKTAEHLKMTSHTGLKNISATLANKVCFAQADLDELVLIRSTFPAMFEGQEIKKVHKFYGEDARKIALLFSDIDNDVDRY